MNLFILSARKTKMAREHLQSLCPW